MEPAEELAPGHEEKWEVWKLLNRPCMDIAR